MNTVQILSLSIFLLGIIPLLLCIIKMKRLKKYKANATFTTAEVKGVEQRRGAKNSVYYLLDIQYQVLLTRQLFNGKAVSGKKYQPGDSMPIMYLTDNPSNFKTDFGNYYKWLLVLCIAVAAAIGWFSYWILTNTYSSTGQPVN